MSAPKERPRRRLFARLAALALGLVLALGAAEALVRARVGSPLPERLPLSIVRANPRRGWEMVPSLEHYTYQHRVRVNALGLRGPEVPETKPPEETRVLCLGDSLTYGQGVADPDTVPARLEAACAALAPERVWRVVNGGLRGYDTAQELALLDELGARIAPDVVLLLWFWNDLEPTDAEALCAKLRAKGPVAFDLDAPPEGAALRRWRWVQLLRRSALVMYLHDLWRARHADRIDLHWAQRGLERLGPELDRFVASCRALDALAVFVPLPDAGSLLGDHPSEPLRVRSRALARERGLAVIDPAPALVALARRRGRAPVIPYDGHYDAEANDAIARAIAEELTRLVAERR